MAYQFASTLRVLLALALLPVVTGAAAASSLGSAVAGAPSLFVLAVAEATGDGKEASREAEARHGSGPEQSAGDKERNRQAAAQPAPQGRPGGVDLQDDSKVALR
jgi:hypothetical protein